MLSFKTDPCGGRVQGPKAAITSPGFPSQYPPNTDCSWTVKFRPDTTIMVTFEQLDMGPDCNTNFLLLYNGDTQMKPHLTQPLCGNKAPSVLVTQSNEMIVEFHSGIPNSEFHSGFKIILEEETTGCGGIVNSNKGSLNSPNYSTKDYPNNVECEWKITLSPGFHAKINFINRFSLESSTGCVNDFIQIFDWINSTWVQIGGNICGREPPTNITTKTNQFRVLFRTSSSITSDGFMLSWENMCGGTFKVDGEGTIISPNYPMPYSSKLLCTYILQAPSKTILGRFEDFAIESNENGSGDGCKHDSVTLVTNSISNQFNSGVLTRLGFRYRSPRRATFCGFQIPQPVYSYGSLELTFRTDSYTEDKGFLFKYSIASCGDNITSPTTISNPSNNEIGSCTWLITAPDDEVVSVTFTAELMFTPRCVLKIYDGHNTSNETSRIVTICSSYSNKRTRFTSTSNKMAVQYDDTRYRPLHFSMHIRFTYGEKHNCGGTIRLADVTLPYTLKSVDVNKDGKYEPNLSCDWLLLAPESHQIRLSFSKFDVQNCTNCSCDVLEVFDGDHNGKPQISYMCGTSNNTSKLPSMISSYGSLLVHFETDGATELSGFELTITTHLSLCGLTQRNASTEVQILQSPPYSGRSELCRWYILSPGRNSGLLSLHITDLDLPSPCSKNYIEIFELLTLSRSILGREGTPSDSQLIGNAMRFCGNRSTELKFLGHNAQIRYVINQLGSHRGFKIEYIMKGCSGNYTQPSGQLTFNYVFYKNGQSCYNLIQAPHSNSTISLFFKSFLCLERASRSNKLMVFDGASDQATEIVSFCAERRPNPVFSTGPALFIKWESIEFLGKYDIIYTTTDKGQGCGGHFSMMAGIFSSPLYPSSYKKDTSCRWDVTVPHGNKIIFKFIFFDIGPPHTCTSNYIKFFDINTATGIETLHSQYCGNQMPAEIQMNGDSAFVQYVTTTQNNGTGWFLQWSSIHNINFDN